MPEAANTSSLWFRGALVLVIPIVVLAILGGTVGEEGILDDVFLWLTFALVALMAICLMMGWIGRGGGSPGERPDEDGVL